MTTDFKQGAGWGQKCSDRKKNGATWFLAPEILRTDIDSLKTPLFVQVEADLKTKRVPLEIQPKRPFSRRFWPIASFVWISNGTLKDLLWPVAGHL